VKWRPVVMPFRTSVFSAVGVLGSHITSHLESSFDEDPKGNMQWLDPSAGYTDKSGFFTNIDGSRAPVVFQWEQFGHKFSEWLQAMVADVFVPVADGVALPEKVHGWIGGGSKPSSKQWKLDAGSKPNAPPPPSPAKKKKKPPPPPPPPRAALPNKLDADHIGLDPEVDALAESKCIPLPKTEAVFPEFGWPKVINAMVKKLLCQKNFVALHH
jgi:hypothetical protein